MTKEPYIDPLEAASVLLHFILEEEEGKLQLTTLARHLDIFLYATRFFCRDGVGFIEMVDEELPSLPRDDGLRERLGRRFPGVGLYWQALDSVIESGKEPVIATGDAIDDILDISAEIPEVKWLEEKYGREQAIAGMRFRYQHHLYMHILPLRFYLEELVHYDWSNDDQDQRG